VSFQ